MGCPTHETFKIGLMKVGLTIAFIGTDGSGKSTIIDHVVPWLNSININGVHYEHLRPNWLPPLRALKGSSTSDKTETVNNPHEEKASGLLCSIIRLAYYWLDYTLGYWIITQSIICRSGKFCLFDRYYYDIIIDPRRLRISLPNWVIRAVCCFAPRPQLVLCLGADPEAIYARKPETSLEEVQRQVSELKALCKCEKNAVWIDTGGAIEDSILDAMSAIKSALSERYGNE